MSRRIAAIGLATVLALGASAWTIATEHRDPARGQPDAAPSPRPEPRWPASGEHAVALRSAALRRAQVRPRPLAPPALDFDVSEAPFRCRFLAEVPTGTSPKFDCVLESGAVVKVKYGRNPEIAAEVAASRLVSALGYPTDRMSIARHVRCDGCPRHPFIAMGLLSFLGLHNLFPPRGLDDGYSDFEWVAVERKFEAAPVEIGDAKGWAWWELKSVDPAVGASRADLDALRLLAVFLAHWDNKAENQRLVCLDERMESDRGCARPLLMLQDLGATFGPPKANLARWHDTPVWTDSATCTVSMEHMPWQGATFPDAQIGEAGRAQLARQLAALPLAHVRQLFAAARFADLYSATNDRKDLDAWTAAFQSRVDQITSTGPCPQ